MESDYGLNFIPDPAAFLPYNSQPGNEKYPLAVGIGKQRVMYPSIMDRG